MNGLPIDQGYAWIVVAASSGLFSLAVGGLKCQGVLLVEMTERYSGVYSPSKLLWIFSVYSMAGGFTGPIVSWLILKLTYRPVAMVGVVLICLSNIALGYGKDFELFIILYSLMGGFGMRMVIASCLLVSMQYFVKCKALAVGIITSGSGVGTIAIPYVLRALFDNMAYSGALLIYGGFSLQFLVLASLLRPISYYEKLCTHKPAHCHEAENSTWEEETEDECSSKLNEKESCLNTFDTSLKVSNHSVVTSVTSIEQQEKIDDHAPGMSSTPSGWKLMLMPQYTCFCFSIMFFFFGMGVVYQCAPSLAEQCEVSKKTVALVIMLAGGLEVPCRISNGLILDKGLLTATQQYILSAFLSGIFALICAIVSGLAGVAIVLIAMASAGCSFYALMPFILSELVGLENVTVAIGIQTFFQSIGTIAGTAISGYIYDQTGDWVAVYYYIAAVMFLASILLPLHFGLLRCRNDCNNPCSHREGPST